MCVCVCVCRAYVVYIEIFERDIAQKEGRRLQEAATKVTNVSVCMSCICSVQ